MKAEPASNAYDLESRGGRLQATTTGQSDGREGTGGVKGASMGRKKSRSTTKIGFGGGGKVCKYQSGKENNSIPT